MSKSGARLTAISLLVLTLLLAYLYGVEPLVLKYQENVETIAAQTFQARRLEALAARDDAATHALAALASDEQYQRMWMSEPNAGLAEAALQERIKRTVSANGGSVISLSPVKAKSEPLLALVSVRAQIRTTTAGLQQTLHALEATPPVLAIRELAIRRARLPNAKARPEDVLEARFRIVGFLQLSSEPGGS